ncbi:hypothetical protein LBW89_20625 [Paenibacillus sp. alder61]|uniref:Uncharacterized protein n=1 Tax=Paenibacillus faecis TaxID=862114 RepID=A0A5D0CX12_9BACL|nr:MULTISPECIES: hypothetical protein [Paenibacillus]MCA1295416.1 hypothetical protein [Paenibacillus sp. alder61]TYA14512.1 hypothetical protein FRY98_02155 [Paenibacillus faecis]
MNTVMLAKIDEKQVKDIKKLGSLFIMGLFISLLLSSCNDNEHIKLQPTTISNIYPGDITKVNKIILVDGFSGKRKEITKKEQVINMLDQIKDELLIPEENQEGGVGYIFRVILYEDEKIVMDFTPHHIQNINFKFNDNLHQKLKEIFEVQFERKF